MNVICTLLEFVSSIRDTVDGVGRGSCVVRRSVRTGLPPRIKESAEKLVHSFSRRRALLRFESISSVSCCWDGIVAVWAAVDWFAVKDGREAGSRKRITESVDADSPSPSRELVLYTIVGIGTHDMFVRKGASAGD